MTAIGIVGSQGRMGRAITAAIEETQGAELAGGVDHEGDVAALAKAADVLVDFSSPDALEATLDACAAAGTPILIGTTGLAERHHYLIDDAARDIAIIQSGNTSLGVTMLAALVRDAAERLGEDWDIEILEMHHRHKVDAPSGTALGLGKAAAKGRGVDHDAAAIYARQGHTGARKEGTIGYATLRGGDVVGDHTVMFAGEGERIEIGHKASSRQVFAAGALRAARWAHSQPYGLYSMRDVLGLE